MWAGLLAFFTAKTLKDFAIRVALFLAIKAVLTTLFIITLPIILFKTWFVIQEYIYSFILDHIDLASIFGTSTKVELTGVGAYLADNLYIVQGISIILSAMVLSFSLSFLRR